MRAHVVISPELVEEVDRLVGPRRRSHFFEEAVHEKVARLKLAEAARKAAGSLADSPIQGWETSESAAEWVHHARRADKDRQGKMPAV